VVFLILMLLLRAVVAPLILVGTVVLLFGTAMGLSALVFRHVLGFAGPDSLRPLFLFVFLVALGIDYNIFLMTRVHEASKQFGTRRGPLIGLAATGGGGSPQPAWSWPARSGSLSRCRSYPSPRSGLRSPWASCSTRWSCARCW
jgi:hypothetical protein